MKHWFSHKRKLASQKQQCGNSNSKIIQIQTPKKDFSSDDEGIGKGKNANQVTTNNLSYFDQQIYRADPFLIMMNNCLRMQIIQNFCNLSPHF